MLAAVLYVVRIPPWLLGLVVLLIVLLAVWWMRRE
jgi:hypothetical protein